MALLGVVVVCVVVLLAVTGYQALKARTALTQVSADFVTLKGQLAAGDQDGARATLATAQEHADVAARNTRGPGWWLSSHVPRIGDDVRAVRAVASVADALAGQVLPDVVDVSATLTPDRLRPVDGRVDLAPLRTSAPAVTRAASRLASERDRVSAIDTGSLLPQVAAPVESLQAKLTDAAGLADRASRAVRLLPPMLGADGPRRYLFLFQNNAEIRATGGIPGSFALLKARDGRLRLGRQDDSGTVAPFRRSPSPLTGDEKAVFGDALGRFFQDVNFTPDFPRTARLVSTMYERRTGIRVDGVVSVDPVALSHVLAGTGPVSTARGQTLTADNVVQLLLSQVYADIPDTSRQNAFFDAAARDVFTAVSTGAGDPRAVLQNLATSASERRLLVWSATGSEQALLDPTALSGRLETARTPRPQVGVYFNAALPYKLDYYLDHDTSVTSRRCVGGRQELSVKVDLSSRVPRSVRSLSSYVAPDVPPFGRGTIVTTLYFLAPVDGSIRTLHVDGEERAFTLQRLDGRPVFARTIALEPGASSEVRIDVLAGRGQDQRPDLRVTPGVRSTGIGSVSDSACS